MKQTKCYIYTRVSTAIQVEGFSLDAQRTRLLKFAEYKGFEVVGEYSDKGRSGKNVQGRPEFQRMIKDIESGKDNVSFLCSNFHALAEMPPMCLPLCGKYRIMELILSVPKTGLTARTARVG